MATMRAVVPSVAAADVTACLAALGVRQGDTLIFHCALSSLGVMEGGAEELVDSILAAVGPEGTAMAPVMPDIFSPIDLANSPSSIGRVAEAFRRRPEAVRSLHPTHSVAAIGPQAAYLTQGHEACTPCGVGSPYEKLARLGGWVLLLGVDQDRNTSLHTAEDLADVPYLQAGQVEVLTPSGGVERVTVPKFPLGHREFIGIDRRLRQTGIVRLGRVGHAVARLMEARLLQEFGLELLHADPAAFLCRKPRCVSCRWGEARIREAVGGESAAVDWLALSRRWGCQDQRCEICYV